MKQFFIIISIIIACVSVVDAQERHSFSVNLGGGRHNIDYDLGSRGDKTPGSGFVGGLGWQWFFTGHWGVGAGVNIHTLKTTSALAYTQSNENLTDPENGLGYTANIVFDRLKEVDKQSVMDIPVSVYYQIPFLERWRVCVGASLVYSAVLSQSYKTDGGSVSLGKYFPEYDLDYSNLDDKEHGVYAASDFSGDMNLKKSLFGVGGDAQVCYAVGEQRRMEITLGIYGVYRFADQQKNSKSDLMDAKTFEYKGVTQSNISGKISSASLGCMVGVRFHIGGKEAEE